MIRFLLTLILATVLVGCGSETSHNNHGFGYEYDQIGNTGLRVRYEPGQTIPSLTEIETLFREVETCIGTSATGPLVIFLDFSDAGIQSSEIGTLLGQIYLDTGTILINTRTVTERKYIYWTLKHEFVHYLLHQSGFDITANTYHQSNLFTDCTR